MRPADDDFGEKWRRRLHLEMAYARRFLKLTEMEWHRELQSLQLTSANYDTVLALDWPHYCTGATVLCGGPRG